MTKPEQLTSASAMPESDRPNVDMVFEALFGSGDPAQKGKL
jgi:hypothetical protein